MFVLCASVEIGMAGERGFAVVFRCGEVPSCFLLRNCLRSPNFCKSLYPFITIRYFPKEVNKLNCENAFSRVVFVFEI